MRTDKLVEDPHPEIKSFPKSENSSLPFVDDSFEIVVTFATKQPDFALKRHIVTTFEMPSRKDMVPSEPALRVAFRTWFTPDNLLLSTVLPPGNTPTAMVPDFACFKQSLGSVAYRDSQTRFTCISAWMDKNDQMSRNDPVKSARAKIQQKQSREASAKAGTRGRREHKGKAATSHKATGGKLAR